MSQMSVGGHVWKSAMEKPFVVRATVGRVSNEKVGQYASFEEAEAVAGNHQDARIIHAVSGADLTDRIGPTPPEEESAAPGHR